MAVAEEEIMNIVYADLQREKPEPQNPQIPSAYFGLIENVSQRYGLFVNYANQVLAAQSLIAVQASDIGRRCALMFENGDETKPLVIGLLWQPDQTETDKRIETTESLILKCGHSSLEMEADGSVRIKGLTITTQAYGANRIKGGSVRIN